MTRRAVLLDLVVRTLYPVMLAVALALLLRGHNEPGGGFIGGMVAVAATGLRAVAAGSGRALRGLPGGPLRLASAGVALSVLSGLPGIALGRPYLAHLWSPPLEPAALRLSTVLMFDVGVFLAVWGALGGIVALMIGIDERETE